MLKTHEPLPTACEAPVEPFHHQHTLLAEGRNAGVSHGQSIGLQQPQRQPFVVDRRPEVRPPPPIRPSGKLEDVTRQHSAARREPLPAPPQESRRLLRTGQQDTEVHIRVSTQQRPTAKRSRLGAARCPPRTEAHPGIDQNLLVYRTHAGSDDAHVDAAITRASTAPSLLALTASAP